MTPSEVALLSRLATGRKVVEVGSWHGHSTIAMAYVADLVVAIDWHKGDGHAGFEDTAISYLRNIERSGLGHRIVSVVARAETALPLLSESSFDLAFIDGFHDYTQVKHDAIACARIVKPGGCLVFHDYGRFPGADGLSMVARAVDEFAAGQGSDVELPEMSLAIVTVNAPTFQ
jgi:predicted O-methyltransferase YrrM